MPTLINATVDDVGGWVELKFSYSPDVIRQIKLIPGAKWDPDRKVWRMALHGWEVFKTTAQGIMARENIARTYYPPRVIPDSIAARLRPYQIDGANFLLQRRGALLTFDMRLGKTPTTIAAITAAMSAGIIDAVIITYPASVAGEWKRQLKDWANVDLLMVKGATTIKNEIKKAKRDHERVQDAQNKRKNPIGRAEPAPEVDVEAVLVADAKSRPVLFIGIHYEILGSGVKTIDGGTAKLLDKMLVGRRYAVIADEVHACKNRKADRTKALHALRENAVFGWGLTGTPMRNRSRDMWGLFEFAQPGSMGGYWTFAKRYCGAVQGSYGWEDHANTNTQELARRLTTISYRKTRAEVAGYLPKSDRRVIECAASASALKKYRALEKVFADRAATVLRSDGGNARNEAALKEMVLATSSAKIPTAIERIKFHADRGVKGLVFCHFHDSLRELDATLKKMFAEEEEYEKNGTPYPGDKLPAIYLAPGWESPDKRREVIQAWKDHDGSAFLLANTLASGIGIDLSDADVAMFLELEWVPADFRQAEDRIQDVHQGKRKTPPLYEYLIVRQTVDESMANALFRKIQAIEKVVGGDAETSNVAKTLEGADFVDAGSIGLTDTKQETIDATLSDLVARLTGEKKSEPGDEDLDLLAATVGEAFDDDQESDQDEEEDGDVPF